MSRPGRKKQIYIDALRLILEEYYSQNKTYMSSVMDFENNALALFTAKVFSENLLDVMSDLLRIHLQNVKDNKWTILPR